MNNQVLPTAIATTSYLPYTMSWIHRQMCDKDIATKLVITQKIENQTIFPHNNTLCLKPEPYWMKALKARIGYPKLSSSLRFSKGNTAKIVQALQENEIQLVHAHFGTYAVLFAGICTQLRIPLVVTFHGHDISSSFNRWPAYKHFFPQLLDQIKFAIVISEEMKQRLLALGCDEAKIAVSYLGVPLDQFPFVERSNRSGVVKFLHAGRLTAKKGVIDLVKAFASTFPKEGEAELLIVGDGEERALTQQAIDEHNVGNYVHMLGRKSNEDLLALRHEADVFVLNCRTDKAGTKEGLPISTLEAACTGLPAISTYHAGVPESIINEETGMLVPEYDNEALGKALRSMMDKKRRLAMGQKARIFMEEKFDLEKCNQTLLKIYQKAVNQ